LGAVCCALLGELWSVVVHSSWMEFVKGRMLFVDKLSVMVEIAIRVCSELLAARVCVDLGIF